MQESNRVAQHCGIAGPRQSPESGKRCLRAARSPTIRTAQTASTFSPRRRRRSSLDIDVLIAEQKFSAAFFNDVNHRVTDQTFDVRHVLMIGEQIIAFSTAPQLLKPGVVDKHLWSAGSIRSVLQIILSPVPQERRAIRIEEHGGE